MLNRKLTFLLTITLLFGGWLIPFNADAAETGTAETQPEVLTLEKCIELASKNSKDLQLISKQVTQKKEALKQARANFLPTLSYEYQTANTETDFGEIDSTDANLLLGQPLYTGGALTAGYRVAKLEYEKALEDQRKVKQELIFGVKQCFYGVWLAGQRLKVTQASYEYMRSLYQQTKKFYDVGTKSKFEFLSAQTEWEKRKPDLIEAQNGVTKAKLQLANLIGISFDHQFRVEDELTQFQLPEKVALSLPALLEEAYEKNPEVRNSEKDLQIAQYGVKIATSGYKPTITAVGRKAISESDPSDPKNPEDTLTIGINLSGVLFNGLKTQSEVASAKEVEAAAKIAASKRQDDIRLSVQEALLDLEASLEKAKANQATSNLAQETLRMTQARYDAGMATTMDISEVQIKVDEALIGYYKGISDYIIALANLDKTLGKDPQ